MPNIFGDEGRFSHKLSDINLLRSLFPSCHLRRISLLTPTTEVNQNKQKKCYDGTYIKY